MRSVVLCLHNAERARRSLPALRLNPQLGAAAQAHSDAMATGDFFAHVSPDGRGPVQRARRAGYPPGAAVGENLAWGEESEATPVRIMQGWMNSRGHRENVVRRGWVEMGVGVTLGAPEPDGRLRAATYVTLFGGR